MKWKVLLRTWATRVYDGDVRKKINLWFSDGCEAISHSFCKFFGITEMKEIMKIVWKRSTLWKWCWCWFDIFKKSCEILMINRWFFKNVNFFKFALSFFDIPEIAKKIKHSNLPIQITNSVPEMPTRHHQKHPLINRQKSAKKNSLNSS